MAGSPSRKADTSNSTRRSSVAPLPELPPLSLVRDIIRRALDEDLAAGDVTSAALVPSEQVAAASLVARQAGVFCGGPLLPLLFAEIDARVRVDPGAAEGTHLEPGAVAARLAGPARALLAGERTALNLVQRLSGIATLTAAYVARVGDLPVRITDTRKTTPGLRVLERYAVGTGGGFNHRMNLADAVLIKDNHLAAVRAGGRDLAAAISAVRARIPHTMRVEVEATTLEEVDAAVAGGADIVLLDNMPAAAIGAAVERIARRAIVECSGGVTLETVRGFAEAGVDVISVGALTHSAPALDLSLEFDHV